MYGNCLTERMENSNKEIFSKVTHMETYIIYHCIIVNLSCQVFIEICRSSQYSTCWPQHPIMKRSI